MTEPIVHHLTMRLEDGRALCRDASQRRLAARCLYEQGESRGLSAFRLADTHVHALIECGRAEAGRFASAVGWSLHARLALKVGFEPTRFRPVFDQRHLVSAFPYVLMQEPRHGILADPFHDASCLPELIGARLLRRRVDGAVDGRVEAASVRARTEVAAREAPRCVAEAAARKGAGADHGVLGERLKQRVAQLLPRVRRGSLLAMVGIADADADGPLVLDDLREAAAAAHGLADLEGRGLDRTRARIAAVHVASGSLATKAIAERLGISTRAVQQLRAFAPPVAAIRAVTLQLRMRMAFRARPHADAPLAPIE